jgi:hypothetical protein
MRSKHCADDALVGTHGHSRGTQGVLKGYSAAGCMRASTRNTDHAPCCMKRTRPNPRCAASLVQTTRRMAQRGTQGVLEGTGLLDGMRASRQNADHASPRHEGDSSNQRCAANLVQTMHCGVLTGTHGYSWYSRELGGWTAPVQSRETWTMHGVASDHTFDQRCAATLCRRRAEWHRGVLKGTEGYSRVLGSWIESMQALYTRIMLRVACGTHVQPAMRCNHRGRRCAGWHGGVIRGYSAAGRRACNEQSGSCNNRCVHAAWQLHPFAMRLYETRYHNGGPTGAIGYYSVCVRYLGGRGSNGTQQRG